MPPLPHADKYHWFQRSIFSELVAETHTSWPSQWTEMDIQSLWFAGEFGHQFTSNLGQKKIFIRDFGIWNHAAGPDFIQTSIEIDGIIHRGDIEIDSDVRDWERHGHGSNPNYNHVILHLFLQQNEPVFFTRTCDHHEITQVQLQPQMLSTGAQPKAQAEARLGRCSTPLAHLDDASVASLITAASQYRLQQKINKLTALQAIHGQDQALFQNFATALGYRPNQRPFTIIAQRLPLKTLLKKTKLEREALLFGVAGFLEPIKDKDTTADTRRYLRSLWSEWWKRRHAYETWLTPHTLPKWITTGTRPGNHPQRRMAALTVLLDHWKSVRSLIDPQAWNRKKWTDSMVNLSHHYWDHHYTLLSKPSTQSIALLGEARVHEFLANIIYPWLINKSPKLWEEYLQLNAVLDNQKIRRAAIRLFGAGSPRSKQFQKRLHQQQGLLQLYEDFCLHDDSCCEDCPFPEQLLKWH